MGNYMHFLAHAKKTSSAPYLNAHRRSQIKQQPTHTLTYQRDTITPDHKQTTHKHQFIAKTTSHTKPTHKRYHKHPTDALIKDK